MGLNFKQIKVDVVNLARGLGYKTKIYSEDGKGPIADAEKAKYVELGPDGILLDLPQGYSSEPDEIYIYVGKSKDKERFLRLIHSIKLFSHMNGLGMTIKNWETPKVTAKDFADKAKVTKEKNLENK